MPDLIEIESLTIDDMRRLAREHYACRDAQEWIDEPDRTVQDVIERVSVSSEYLRWAIRNVSRTVNLLSIQDAIINQGTNWSLREYARRITGADLDRILDEVIRRGDMMEVYNYVRGIPGADKARAQDALINGGNAVVMYLYAHRVPGADIERLQDAVIECGDIGAMELYEQYVAGADTALIQAAIREVKRTS